MMSRLRVIVLSTLLTGVLACATDFTEAGPETAAGPDPTTGRIQPLCQLGCVDEDPFPEGPGVYLGSGVTPWECFSGGHTDQDLDGLSDFCEDHLSLAFRPELQYASGDYVAREPYWAARPTGNRFAPIRLAFLLSYYRDEGSSSWLCGLPGASSSCHGHNGDSELIVIDVYYDDEMEHWLTNAIYYSRHGSYGVAVREQGQYYAERAYAGGYPLYAVQYPDRPGAYPRAYVSVGKHANYCTQNECNSGAWFSADTCDGVNTYARVEWSSFFNIGSRAHPRLDCVTARSTAHPYYGSGRQECYWTTLTGPGGGFRGWYPVSVGGDTASSYSPMLGVFGY